MRRMILARHGESEYSARGCINGDPSIACPLTERGRREARELGEALADDPVDVAVVTEFERTRATAEGALEGRDVPLVVVPELNDPRFGDLEGRPLDDLRRWLRDAGPLAEPAGGGESRVAAVERISLGFRKVLDRPEPAVLVIAHGLPVTYAVLGARGEEFSLTLEGIQARHAEPHRLSRADLSRAVDRMERWARGVVAGSVAVTE